MLKNKLTKNEYLQILQYYKKDIGKDSSIKEIKEKAESLVAKKLCECIKIVNKEKHKDGEKRSIAICKNSILLNKGISDSGFRCKDGRPRITLKKYSNPIFKSWKKSTRKNIKNIKNRKSIKNRK